MQPFWQSMHNTDIFFFTKTRSGQRNFRPGDNKIYSANAYSKSIYHYKLLSQRSKLRKRNNSPWTNSNAKYVHSQRWKQLRARITKIFAQWCLAKSNTAFAEYIYKFILQYLPLVVKRPSNLMLYLPLYTIHRCIFIVKDL